MSFPNTKQTNLIIFWVVISICISLFGITVANLSNILPGSHPIIDQVNKIFISDKPITGVLLSFVGFVLVGYVLFSVWVMISFIIFYILSRFDDDLKNNIHFMFPNGEDWEIKISAQELSNLIIKVVIFVCISSSIGAVLLTLLHSWNTA